MFCRSFRNYHHFWFRNETVTPSVGINFWFLWFHDPFSDLSSEEIFGKEIEVSWIQNLKSTSLNPSNVYPNAKKTTTSTPSHLRMTTMEASDQDSVCKFPSQPGALASNFRGSWSGHVARSWFGFINSVWPGFVTPTVEQDQGFNLAWHTSDRVSQKSEGKFITDASRMRGNHL